MHGDRFQRPRCETTFPYCEQALRAEPTGTASRRSNPTVAL